MCTHQQTCENAEKSVCPEGHGARDQSGTPQGGVGDPSQALQNALQPKPSHWAEGGKEALWDLGVCGAENLQGEWEVTMYGEIKT